MRKKRLFILLGLVGLLTMMSFPVDVVAQTYDWSDDFDDGNYDGWTVVDGTYDATGNELVVTAVGAGDAHPFINHPSNTTFGNWSFDVTIVDDPDPDPDHASVSFMSDHPGLLGIVGDVSFMLWWQGSSWTLYREATEIDSFPADKYWEHHIRVERTRAEPNTFNVYHNGTLALESIVIVPTANWSYFGFTASVGSSIDNINVEYEPEIITSSTTTTTTTTTTTETTTTTSESTTSPEPTDSPDMTMILIIAGGGAAVLVVIVIIVKMRS